MDHSDISCNLFDFTGLSCREFIFRLGSGDPIPGGGGASALAGALGTALGRMVGSLTTGKKKYADVEDEIQALIAEAMEIEEALIRMVARDGEVFAPLVQAYRNPEDTETMEKCLVDAAQVPLEIMELCCRAIRLQGAFADKGSRLALSDAGSGAVLCAAALKAASLNVYINTKAMKNRAAAEAMNREAGDMLAEYAPMAEGIYARVRAALGGE